MANLLKGDGYYSAALGSDIVKLNYYDVNYITNEKEMFHVADVKIDSNVLSLALLRAPIKDVGNKLLPKLRRYAKTHKLKFIR